MVPRESHNAHPLFPPLLTSGQWAELRREFRLTERECEVAALLTRGLSNEQAATSLGISVPTLREHCKAVYRKLGCSSRLALTLRLVHRFR